MWKWLVFCTRFISSSLFQISQKIALIHVWRAGWYHPWEMSSSRRNLPHDNYLPSKLLILGWIYRSLRVYEKKIHFFLIKWFFKSPSFVSFTENWTVAHGYVQSENNPIHVVSTRVEEKDEAFVWFVKAVE